LGRGYQCSPVRSVLARDGAFALVLEGNCTHALGPLGGIAATAGLGSARLARGGGTARAGAA
jgi:hypothetical protein